MLNDISEGPFFETCCVQSGGKKSLARLQTKRIAKRLRGRGKQWSGWIRSHVPPGGRAPLGLVLIIGGMFGFLPVLGFWMIPLGVVVLAMDIVPLFRTLTNGRERRPSERDADQEAPPPQERPEDGNQSDRS